MLDYTKAAVKKIIADLKHVNYVRAVVTQCVYIAYLLYALFSARGPIILNAILLGLATVYFAFFLFMTSFGKTPDGKPVQKRVATVYRYGKLGAQLFNIAVMLYSIGSTAKRTSALSLVFSALLIVAWILQIIFEIVVKYAANKAHLFIEGLEADLEQATKPVRAVGLCKAFFDYPDYYFIGAKLARINKFFGFKPHFSAKLYSLSDYNAGRDGRNTKSF